MKVAILTLTPSDNYGGILQATALFSYLSQEGHDVTLLNKVYVHKFWRRFFLWAFEILPFQNFRGIKERSQKKKKLKKFIENKITKISGAIRTISDFDDLLRQEKYDAVIVGSDQVWRYGYINDGSYPIYFLKTPDDISIRKISYAASFGVDMWEAPLEIEGVSKLLADFHSISVREKSGVDLCQTVFKKNDVAVVLDPTLLHDASFYQELFNGVEQAGDFFVTYTLDSSAEKETFIEKLKKEAEFFHGKSLKRINLAAKKNDNQAYSVEEWLFYIKNSKFVVTDSFHGMVFSINFEVPFVAIGNIRRGMARFESITSSLGIGYRLYALGQLPEIFDKKLFVKDDYAQVKQKLFLLKKYSVDFLKNSLN